MKKSIIIQDYYGRKNIINNSKIQSKTIFIIDDSKLLEGTLSRKDYSVQTFSTGEEVLRFVSMKPDITLIE
jgi:DNA-binding NtrC family response regulator